MARHYDEAKVVRTLSRKKSIKFNRSFDGTNVIVVDKDHTDVGIRSWGKISYLVNYCHYIQSWDKNVRGGQNFKDDDNVNVRSSKRDKLNLASMVKNVLKSNKSY